MSELLYLAYEIQKQREREAREYRMIKSLRNVKINHANSKPQWLHQVGRLVASVGLKLWQSIWRTTNIMRLASRKRILAAPD